jgi:beta-glucosidase
VVFDRLGDRVPYWTTICEIQIINHNSYVTGEFPPNKTNLSESLRANHHLLLGQGLAVQAFRGSNATGEIGNQHLVVPIRPISDSDADAAAASRVDAYFNLLATDPQLRGEYPQALVDFLGDTWPHDAVVEGDLKTISTPMDFFGMDYYLNFTAGHDLSESAEKDLLAAALRAEVGYSPPSGEGLRDALVWVRDRYGNIPIHLLEIGIHLEDAVIEGEVNDADRIAYFHDLLTGAHRAIAEGVDLRSCFIWSFLDGWEFDAGLSYRYGLVHVNYETQERTIKASGHWYRDLIGANGLVQV